MDAIKQMESCKHAKPDSYIVKTVKNRPYDEITDLVNNYHCEKKDIKLLGRQIIEQKCKDCEDWEKRD